ncbi:MAG: addiction module protein [Hyphomicrobiaceae bacterium]|nr:addiction module protein [Hyphomicrobiaceae bacterium]
MNKRVELIIEEARKLTADEREELFARLAIEFDGEPADGTPEEIEAAWLDEVERRAAAVEKGEMDLVPSEHVFAEMRRRLDRS